MKANLSLAAIVLVATTATLTARAPADFISLTFEIDQLALDGVTPLADLPGYDGELVFNIYAMFDDPDDRAAGVSGSTQFPFDMRTCGADYVNAEILGSDTPPSQAEAESDPTTNWDSFVTIGLKFTGPDDYLILSPDMPGPNAEDAPGGVWGNGHENMSWLAPPVIDGKPNPQTVAGPDGRVLLMRLALPPGAAPRGSFGVLVFTAQGPATVGVMFGTITDPCPCVADVALPQDGVVNVDDLAALILAWGETAGPEDINLDGIVDVNDLVALILAWGPCP